jgi:ferredoxin
MEVFGAPRDVTAAEGYPKDFEPKKFKLTVLRGIQEDVIEADSREPLTVALERAGIKNNSRCRSGACGYCRTKLVSGNVFVPEEGDGRRRADKQFGYVHACSTWPLSDCTILIPIL